MDDRPRPSPEQLARYAAEFNESASLKAFGVRVEFPDADRIRCVVDPVRPEHRGGLGSDAVNGGVLAAMFDLALGASVALIDPTRRSATVQLSMSFMDAVRGDRFEVEARIDRAGNQTVFSSAELRDAKGRLCAKATGVMRIGRMPWASGGSPAIN